VSSPNRDRESVTRTRIIRYNRRTPPRSLITRLAHHIVSGGLAVIPTETQYALTADATSARAVRDVRCLKERDAAQPLSIFLPDADSLAVWKIRTPEWARLLTAAYWPGPLTLVLPTDNPKLHRLGSRQGVGVRVSPEPIVALLAKHVKRPLIATSANPSGVAFTLDAENVWLRHNAESGHFHWARPWRFLRRPPSTVLDCCSPRPKLIRAGAIPAREWRRTVRKLL
jgi:L-threonylcarbamoyladenylate synthase